MAVVGQKISTLASTAIIEDDDSILIARQGQNWRLLGSAVASQTDLTTLSGDVKQNYIAKPLNPSAGQLLTWNSTTSTWVASGSPVSIPKGVNSGDLLVYNKNSSTWTTQPSSVLVPKNVDTIPVGTIVAYASSAPPAGWLPCDGRLLAKTGIYADLYKAIGDAFTSPAQANFFRIPDLRGEFVRGWDNRSNSDSSAKDPSRIFGSNQIDSLSSHNHGVYRTYLPSGFVDDVGTVPLVPIDLATPGSTPSFVPTANVGGTETRPKNVALLYCIKFTSSETLNSLGLSAQAILNQLPFGYLGQSPQTWQDVSNSRFTETWITNSTQRPIYVHIHNMDAFFTGECYAEIRPIGLASVRIEGTRTDGENSSSLLSFIVPPSYEYKVTMPNSGGIDNWVELR
jgi:hypothetical protein